MSHLIVKLDREDLATVQRTLRCSICEGTPTLPLLWRQSPKSSGGLIVCSTCLVNEGASLIRDLDHGAAVACDVLNKPRQRDLRVWYSADGKYAEPVLPGAEWVKAKPEDRQETRAERRRRDKAAKQTPRHMH